MYLGVPLEEFSRTRTAAEIADARRELGIRPEEFAIGTVTRLHDSKGNSYLVDAAAEVVRQRPAARFFLVGEGPLLGGLQAQAAALGLGDRFVFAGFRRDVAGTLSAFDLSVFPSLWEGTPITAFEALAMGKPIVSTDADGLLDILTADRDALIVPRRDAAALAARIVWAMDHPEERARLGGLGPRDRPAVRHRCLRPEDGAAVPAAAPGIARVAPAGRACRRSRVSDGSIDDLASPVSIDIWGRRSSPSSSSSCCCRSPARSTCPRTGYGIKSDEATYVAMALSVAYDGDLTYRAQRSRAVRRPVSQRTGRHLPEARQARCASNSARRSPSCASIKRDDANPDRLYFGKAFDLPDAGGAARVAVRPQRPADCSTCCCWRWRWSAPTCSWRHSRRRRARRFSRRRSSAQQPSRCTASS